MFRCTSVAVVSDRLEYNYVKLGFTLIVYTALALAAIANILCCCNGHVIKLSIIPDVLGIVVVAGSGINTTPAVIGIAVDVLINLHVIVQLSATYFSY